MRANVENEKFFLKLVKDGHLLIQPDGTVLNTKTLKVYKRRAPKGHIPISWKVNGRMKHILAHRLIYLAVKGPLLPDEQVLHKDGVKWNNLPSNLDKTDNSGNVRHAYKIGLTAALGYADALFL